jgi:hypothetical protein
MNWIVLLIGAATMIITGFITNQMEVTAVGTGLMWMAFASKAWGKK